MAKNKKQLLPLPVSLRVEPEPFLEIPTDPPPMRKRNRLPLKHSRFVIAYSKHGNATQAVREAGFETKHPSHKAQTLLKDPKIKNAIQPFVDQINVTREKFMRELDKRADNLEEADVDTLLKAVDVLTKNSQLLSGNATENVAVLADVSEGYRKLIEETKNK